MVSEQTCPGDNFKKAQYAVVRFHPDSRLVGPSYQPREKKHVDWNNACGWLVVKIYGEYMYVSVLIPNISIEVS